MSKFVYLMTYILIGTFTAVIVALSIKFISWLLHF